LLQGFGDRPDGFDRTRNRGGPTGIPQSFGGDGTGTGDLRGQHAAAKGYEGCGHFRPILVLQHAENQRRRGSREMFREGLLEGGDAGPVVSAVQQEGLGAPLNLLQASGPLDGRESGGQRFIADGQPRPEQPHRGRRQGAIDPLMRSGQAQCVTEIGHF